MTRRMCRKCADGCPPFLESQLLGVPLVSAAMDDDVRRELDTYRAEGRAQRAEQKAFRAEVRAYRDEVVAWRDTLAGRFERLEARFDRLDHEVGLIARRLLNGEP